jgi:hypothetical protein
MPSEGVPLPWLLCAVLRLSGQHPVPPADDSPDVVSEKPFACKVTGVYGPIGTGNTIRGCGPRQASPLALAERGGGGALTEAAVLAALTWLAKNQNPDGSWSAGRDDFRSGATGLALLAFLGRGYTHLSKDNHGGVVRRGLESLLSQQDVEGCLSPRSGEKYMYSHAIATLAVVEAYGLTSSNLFKDQAQKAVDFLVAAQNPGRGWRYIARSGDNDSSVTGWAVGALRSAQLGQLSFPRSSHDGARAWFDEATDDGGRTGYTMKGSGKRSSPGPSDLFAVHDTLTAIAMSSRILIDRKKSDPRLAETTARLLKDLPAWDEVRRDYVYWFWASQALFSYDGPSGPVWKAWNKSLVDVVTKHQEKDGSWPPSDRWSPDGGRVYATAINALTMEVYYRSPIAFR